MKKEKQVTPPLPLELIKHIFILAVQFSISNFGKLVQLDKTWYRFIILLFYHIDYRRERFFNNIRANVVANFDNEYSRFEMKEILRVAMESANYSILFKIMPKMSVKNIAIVFNELFASNKVSNNIIEYVFTKGFNNLKIDCELMMKCSLHRFKYVLKYFRQFRLDVNKILKYVCDCNSIKHLKILAKIYIPIRRDCVEKCVLKLVQNNQFDLFELIADKFTPQNYGHYCQIAMQNGYTKIITIILERDWLPIYHFINLSLDYSNYTWMFLYHPKAFPYLLESHYFREENLANLACHLARIPGYPQNYHEFLKWAILENHIDVAKVLLLRVSNRDFIVNSALVEQLLGAPYLAMLDLVLMFSPKI